MLDDVKKNAEHRMGKSLEVLEAELTKLRAGRAHPSLLDHIRIDYYGSPMLLSQVATIGVENNRTLTVTPWEKAMVAPIEKAIRTSDLGLNPSSAGLVIRVPLPALTEERRRDLGRIVRDEGEKARVSIRSVRREENQALKDLLKSKLINEDEAHRGEAEIQKITDRFITKVDDLVVKKEQDLLAV